MAVSPFDCHVCGKRFISRSSETKRVWFMGGDFKNLEYVCSSCFTDIGEAAYKVLSNPNVSPEEASLEAKKYLEEDALAEERRWRK